MPWIIKYHRAARKDVETLDGSCKAQVIKAIRKVSQNPLPYTEGGYGKPLGHKANINLSGLLKIKLKRLGLRVVYQLIRTKREMIILVISIRSDNNVYEIAKNRITKEN